jgi:amino acid adenylation domain-containing protein
MDSPNDIEQIYELSPLQQAMLFHSLYAPGSGVYVLQMSLRLTGRLDVPAFERAWQRVVERHAILRTGFFWEDLEKPLQVVYRQIGLPVTRVSCCGLGADAQRTRLAEYLESDRERGFDPTAAPLMRLALFELGPGVHQLVWSQHHLVIDGWSRGQLLRELFTCYKAFTAGREPRLERPRGYREHISWLQRQDPGQAERFWTERLAGLTAPTFIADGDGRPDGPTFRGSRRRDLLLEPASSGALREVARRHRLTLNSLVQGAWALLLAQATGREDVLFGATVAGRPADLPGVESIVGPFINTLPVRVELIPERRLREWLAGLQERLAEMRRFEHAALVDLQRWSELPGGVALFDHLLVFENLALPPELAHPLPELEIAEDTASSLTNYPLTVIAIPGRELALSILYDAGRFDAPEVTRMLERLAGLLTAFAEDRDPRLRDLPLLLPGERHQVLTEANDTAVAYPREACLAELFEAVAAGQPDAPALIADGEVWSYRRLDDAASRLARRLREAGVEPEMAVGIAMERSPELIVGVLAILKAGGAYVPLDPSYPEERLAFMLADTEARIVLAAKSRAGGSPSPGGGWVGDGRGGQGVRTLCVDLAPLTTAAESTTEPFSLRVPADSLALVIYTSGSTGRPKGVALPQRGIVRLVRNTKHLCVGPGDRMAHAASISFDAATLEIWGALLNGAALVVIPREVVLSPADLAARLERDGVTALFLTTALFNQMAREEPGALGRLRTVMFGGEAADPAAVARALRDGPPERLVHLYGPAESTTLATWHLVREVPPGAVTVPIGLPVASSSVYVLDRRQPPVPPGVVGELCVGGDGLARGYLNRPELTAERFIPHPWASGERLYRTGDLVRRRADGAIEFVGRGDDQVKIRGFRIEPKEIEAVLAGHPEVRDCAVLARREVPGAVRLAAYVVGSPSGESLRAWLAERLPGYMVPTAFVHLDAMPLTANGKLDRRALPAPARTGSADGDVSPADPVEELLAGLWAEVLGLDRAGVHDDFFALGGHSLLATQVVSRIRGAFGVDLPLRTLFEAPTVAQLARAVRESRRGAAAPPIVPVPRDGRELPLSFAQQRLWLIDQLEPANPAYNIPSAVRLTGEISPALLARIFAGIVRRHEALRTVFDTRDGRPVQIIAPELRPGMSVVDLTSVPTAGREALALALAGEETRRPFDLRQGPLLRLTLIRLAAQEHLLVLTLHHIVSDGWSMRVLLREIAVLAAASPLPELPVQYADFAAWQRSWLQGEVISGQLDWWRRELEGAPGELALPVDRTRGPLQSREGALVPVTLPAGLTAGIRQLARAAGVTPFMVLAAAFQTLLHRLGGQEDVLVGTPTAGRNRLEAEGLIGFFVNTLVLRGRFGSGELSFRGLLEKTRETVLGAFEHQDLPFERLVEELVPERNLAVSPLFQVLFTLQTASTAPVSLPGLTLEPVLVYSGQAQFDLSLELAESGDRLHGVLELSRALFDRVTGQRLVESLVQLLQGAVAEPEQQIAELPLLAEAQRHQVLREWNDNGALQPEPVSILPLFEQHAALAPGAPALSHEGRRLTYGELDRRANRLAHRLRRLGVGPETPVAVLAERSPELIVAFLGILKAGGAYVPLDPSYPQERRAFMLESSRAALLLTPEHLAGDLSGAGEEEAPSRGLQTGQLAYVLYTSGSTGRPKGAMVSHGALARYVQAVRPVYEIGPSDRVLQFCSTSFDTSLEEIVACLTAGAELVLRTDAMLGSVATFLDSCRAQGLTVLSLPTAYWHEIVAKLETEGLSLPSCLRLIILGGERTLPGRVAAWRRAAPERPRLLNSYGVTESTIVSTATDLAAPSAAEARGEVSIGRAIRGTELLLLDREMEPVPIGIAGELWIGGAGGGLLARGYLGRPDLTAERFVPHPFAAEPGARLYRTGDLARASHDGTLEFAGRADRQVKIRGYRIETAEIEARLLRHPGVESAVVIVREDQPGEKVLTAYVVPRRAPGPAPAALRAFLRETLPDYMVPNAWVALTALPLTPNGKVDRRALPVPSNDFTTTESPAAPSDPIEELLAGIWAEVLERDRIGVHDDFFTLGGHSLLATQVVSRIRAVLGTELPLRRIFEAPTVAGLARAVRAARQEGAQPPIGRAARDGDLPLSFAQQRLWFLDRLEPESPVYNMPSAVRLTGEVSPALLERIFTEIVRRHEALRTTFDLRDGRPVQVIAPERSPGLPLLDLTGLPRDAREAQARALAAGEARRPFDLRSGPLLRLSLVRLDAREHLLLLTLHHIVADGWSLDVLLREIAALHAAFSQGRPSPLPELPAQYADFAVWQRSWLRGEVLEAQLDAWKRRLAGAPQALDLPTDRPRPDVQTSRGAVRSLDIPPALAEAVRTLCRREGVTLFMVALAAWSTLLGRLAGQDDLLLGTPVAGRNQLETEGLIGFFVNTLVLRTDLSGAPAFREVLARTRETTLDAFAHQDLPFERLVEELVLGRDLSRSPLFQVMLALQNPRVEALEIPGLILRPLVIPSEVAPFDLSLTLSASPAGLLGALEHNTDLFDGSTAERLGTRFVALLEAVATGPGITLPDLPLLLAGERPQVLASPRPQPRRPAVSGEPIGPRDALELQLVQIWEQVLKRRSVGIHDDFFLLGGHSLLAVQVTAHIQSRLGRSLPLAALLRHPTVESLAALLRQETGTPGRTPLVELAAGPGRPLFLVHPAGGEVLCYVPLARHLTGPVYGLQAPEERLSLEEMASLYLRSVRTAQPEGPYLLGGWSFGGAVAFEMARQLESRGETVERVLLIDSLAPGDLWREPWDEGALVAAFALDLARLLGVAGAALPDGFAQRSPADALAWLAEHAEASGFLPSGLGAAELEHRFATFAASHRAMVRYRGGPCAAPLLLLRAAESAAAEPDLGWGRVAGRPVEVHELPGDHYTLLQEPLAERLAEIIDPPGGREPLPPDR